MHTKWWTDNKTMEIYILLQSVIKDTMLKLSLIGVTLLMVNGAIMSQVICIFFCLFLMNKHFREKLHVNSFIKLFWIASSSYSG